jgi:hypothetical protein
MIIQALRIIPQGFFIAKTGGLVRALVCCSKSRCSPSMAAWLPPSWLQTLLEQHTKALPLL